MARRLSAILAIDMVGYSRRMRDDEAGTLKALRRLRNGILEPNAERFGGRIIKLMGDGALMEFSSVVDAVAFAVATQSALATQAQSLHARDAPRYRIGINIGDVVVDGQDILGDGVNLASRLEGLAEPGGICVSGNVAEQIADKLDLTISYLGEREVKNFAEPINAYAVVFDDKAAALASDMGNERADRRTTSMPAYATAAVAVFVVLSLVWLGLQSLFGPLGMSEQSAQAITGESAVIRPENPSIAVLPFVNRSSDDEQEYFSDGLSEDLITDLSHISGLTVIARTSSFAYKGQSKDVRVIGKELGARYILEGSVRKADGRVRITAQLTAAQNGQHVWSGRFDEPINNLFDLQDVFRQKIVSALALKLNPGEVRRLAHRATSSTEAYDLYLRARNQESHFTRRSNEAARALLRRAIGIDPKFADAYARLAQNYSLAAENGWVEDRDALSAEALALAQKAVEIDDSSPYAHWSLGRIYSRAPLRDFDQAIAQLRKAIALDPNYADGYAFLASLMDAVGRAEEALGLLDKAMRINPHFPFWYLFELGRAQYFLTRFEIAAANLKKATQRNPTVPWPHRWLVAAYGQLGKRDDAAWELAELDGLGQSLTIETAREGTTIRHPAYVELFVDGLRKAGVPER